jgi:hypothetical protein
MATTSLVFGLCSLVFPLLLIPGLILGIRSLQRINADPSLGGRGRSIAGIVTSSVLGALSSLAVVAFVLGATSHLNIPRVETTVQSLVQSDVEHHYGVVPDITVQCPSSEPRATGTTFTCTVSEPKTGTQFTTQIDETDGNGDFTVSPLQQIPSGNVVTTTPPVVTTTPPPIAAAPMPLTGSPGPGEVAVIGVNAGRHAVTLEPPRSQDVMYTTCPQFQAVSASGAPVALSNLGAGDFATDQIDAAVPCLSRLSLLAPSAPPQCSSAGGGGAAVVTFEGVNPTSHALLFLPSGPGETVSADRWCDAPTVVGAGNAATTLSKIPKGTQIQLLLSENDWVTGVTVRP